MLARGLYVGARSASQMCSHGVMHRTHSFLSALSLLTVLSACAPADTTISLQGYDRSCSTAADCVVVQSGDICGCNCGNDAISRADLDKYNAELKEKEAS